MEISNDTYALDASFPFHMNRLWMKKHHYASTHYHWHSFYEITYINSGCAVCFVDGERFPVRQGDMVVFNMDEIHGWEMEDDVELLVMTFSADFLKNCQQMDSSFTDFFHDEQADFMNLLDGALGSTKAVQTSMWNAWQEWQMDAFGKRLMIRAEVIKIIIMLARHFRGGNVNYEAVRQRRKQLKRLDKVLKHLDTHYMEKISLEATAEIAHMSPGYFSRYFHQITGRKYIDYLVEKRIEMAKELLETTDRNVMDIAISCGFNNMANFYKSYRRVYGSAPRR